MDTSTTQRTQGGAKKGNKGNNQGNQGNKGNNQGNKGNNQGNKGNKGNNQGNNQGNKNNKDTKKELTIDALYMKAHGRKGSAEQISDFADLLKKQKEREDIRKSKVAISADQMRWEHLDKFVDEKTGVRIKTLFENAPTFVERSGRPGDGRIVYFAYIRAHGQWVIGVEYPFSSAALFFTIRSSSSVRIDEAIDVKERFHDPSKGAIKFVRSKANLNITELFSRPTQGDFEPVPTDATKLSPSPFEYVVQTSDFPEFLTRRNFLKLKFNGTMLRTLVDNASNIFGDAIGHRKSFFGAGAPAHKLVYVGFDEGTGTFAMGFDYMQTEASCAVYVEVKGGRFVFNGTIKPFETSFFPDGYTTIQQTKGRLYDVFGDPFDVELAASVRQQTVDHSYRPSIFNFNRRKDIRQWEDEMRNRAPIAPRASSAASSATFMNLVASSKASVATQATHSVPASASTSASDGGLTAYVAERSRAK